MPLRNRKQSANANPHDKRHEHGVVLPTKRVTKQRSDAHLAGHGIDASYSPKLNSTEPSVRGEEEQYSSLGRFCTDGDTDETPSTPSEMEVPSTKSRNGSIEDLQGQLSDETMEVGSVEHATTVESQDEMNVQTSKIESRASESFFNPTDIFVGPYSLRDVIAVLLFLLQLPASMVMAVQLVFIILTLGNSSSNWSISSLTSPSEWFHSYGGNPSLMTILVADVFFGLAYYVFCNLLPTWSSLVLDLAQAVIAMSLFGGGSTLNGGWGHSTICLLIVALPHFARNINWKQVALDPMASMLSRTGLESTRLARLSSLHSFQHSSHNWIQLLLEIHIITQGLVRVVRRATQPRGLTDNFPATNAIFSADPQNDGTRNTSGDGRPPGPPPSNKDGKDKPTIGKRRRRQTNSIRNQQPFWASVATSKISFTKDVETAHIQRDAFEVDSDKAILEDAKREALDGRVWVTRVDTTEVSFAALQSDTAIKNDKEAAGDMPGESHSLRIKLNNAPWRHFSSHVVHDSTNGTRRISGNVFGLTPGERYFIEFLGVNGKMIYSAHLLTRVVTASEATPAILPAPATDSLRPSSPTTTLKKSIGVSESQLSEIRSRLKKNRKDHRTTNGKLEREVDGLESKMTSFTTTDDKLRQRQSQFRQNIKQADDVTVSATADHDNLSISPDVAEQAHDAMHLKWQAARDRRNMMRQEYDTSRTENERHIQSAHSDNSALRQKRDRLEARLTRLDQQKEALVACNLATRKEKAQWDTQRSNVRAALQAREADLNNNLRYVISQRQQLEGRTAQLDQQNYYFESKMQSQSNGGTSSAKHTPEAAYSALNNRQAGYNGYSSFGYNSGTPPIGSRQNSVRKQRGRSSSMLSDISGFTDAETVIASTPLMEDMPAVSGFTLPPLRGHSAGSASLSATIAPPPGLGLSHSGSSSGKETPASPGLPMPIGHEMGRGSPRGFNRS